MSHILCQNQIHLAERRSTYCMMPKGHTGECKPGMNANEYQLRATATASPIYLGDRRLAFLLASSGICAESGELLNKVKKCVERGVNVEAHMHHWQDELGDILWYAALIAKLLGCTLEEIMDKNIQKLKERHGDSYNPNYTKKAEATK